MRKGTKFLIGSGLILALSGPLWGAEKKATVKVYGMSCQMCANGVAGSLKQLKGVKSAEVSVKGAQAVVVYDDEHVTVAQIKKQIEKSGFSTEPKGQ
jgi:copper chaperone CopZ